MVRRAITPRQESTNVNRARHVRTLIQESHQGYLYHATSYGGLMSILSGDSMVSGYGTFNKKAHVSFSRSRASWFNSPTTSVRLVIDGDRLSQDYRLEPFVCTPEYGKQHPYTFEYETCVKEHVVHNIHRYLVAIEFLNSPPKSYIVDLYNFLYDNPLFNRVKVVVLRGSVTDTLSYQAYKRYGDEENI